MVTKEEQEEIRLGLLPEQRVKIMQLLEHEEELKRLIDKSEIIEKMADERSAYDLVTGKVKRSAVWFVAVVGAIVLFYDKFKLFVQSLIKP